MSLLSITLTNHSFRSRARLTWIRESIKADRFSRGRTDEPGKNFIFNRLLDYFVITSSGALIWRLDPNFSDPRLMNPEARSLRDEDFGLFKTHLL